MNWFFRALACSAACVHPAAAQVVQTPSGPVEFIGLEQWTLDMVRDSLAAKSPGTPLDQCAVVLEEQLGFPGAAVQRFIGPDGQRYTVVTLVEPHAADRVQYRPRRAARDAARAEWQEGGRIFDEHGLEFQAGLKTYGLFRAGRHDEARSRVQVVNADMAAVEALWRFLASHATPADREVALAVLADDAAYRNRALAAAILASFADSDEAWHALADALRDPVGPVSSAAADALQAMTAYSDRHVDWAAAAASIRHVLDGTNLFMLHPLMEVLVATRVSPDLAPALLGGGGHLALANLRANREQERRRAHALLVQLRGEDPGTDAAAWEAWIGTLNRD